MKPTNDLKDGESCQHPGCTNHVTHPCECCGRTQARGEYKVPRPEYRYRDSDNDGGAIEREQRGAASVQRPCSASLYSTVSLPDGIVIGGPWPHTIVSWPGGKYRGATKPEYDLFQALEAAHAAAVAGAARGSAS